MTKIQEAGALNLESLDFIRTTHDREELLDEYASYQDEEKNLSFKNLLWTFSVVFVVLILFLTKVAISNIVYKKSISLYKIEKELEYLSVQQKDIIAKIQKKRYKLVLADLQK